MQAFGSRRASGDWTLALLKLLLTYKTVSHLEGFTGLGVALSTPPYWRSQSLVKLPGTLPLQHTYTRQHIMHYKIA